MTPFDFSLLVPALGGAIVFAAILSLIGFRLPLVIRGYIFVSFFVGVLAIVLGQIHGIRELIFVGIAAILVKAIAVPMIISRTAERCGASMRLTSYIRPTPTYFVASLLLLVLIFAFRQSPFFADVNQGYLSYVSVTLVLIGFLMMILRKNIYSQMIGFLIMENGIAVFSISTLDGVPFLIETGVLSAVLIAALLMTMLSSHIRQLYGTEDTTSLRELID